MGTPVVAPGGRSCVIIPIPLDPSVLRPRMANPSGAGSSGLRRLAARRLLPSCTLSPERLGTALQAPFRHLAQGAMWLSLFGRAAPRVSFSPGVPDLSASFRARGALTLTPPFRGSSLGCPLLPRGVEHPSLCVPRAVPWVISYFASRVLSPLFIPWSSLSRRCRALFFSLPLQAWGDLSSRP